MNNKFIFKADPEKVSNLKATLKEGIFRSKLLSAEQKLEMFQSCLEDIDNAEQVLILDGDNLQTQHIREDNCIARNFDLKKCYGPNLTPMSFAAHYKNCFVEFSAGPGACKTSWLDHSGELHEVENVVDIPTDFSFWNIYTPDLFKTLDDRIPTKLKPITY